MAAVKGGNKEVVQMLLAAGADLKAVDKVGVHGGMCAWLVLWCVSMVAVHVCVGVGSGGW